MPAEDEGLRIILSAVQLAAVMRGATLFEHERKLYRIMGTLQLIGSAFELVGGVGLELVPEPTMLTKVGGAILIGHSVDRGVAAARQVWSGQPTEDLTQQLGEQLAYGVGASPKVAQYTGIALDIGVSLGVSTAVSAERLAAVKAGRISLDLHETTATEQLGHTIQEHVGKDEAYLRARVNDPKKPWMKTASTFANQEIAETVISDAMRSEKAGIQAWAAGANQGERYWFNLTFKKPIGVGYIKATNKLEQMYTVRIGLERTQIGGRVYFILTAYPK